MSVREAAMRPCGLFGSLSYFAGCLVSYLYRPLAHNAQFTHLFSGSHGRRAARSDSLPDPGVVVRGPERELQDAPEQRIGEMHTADARGSTCRTCAAPAVRRAEQANEHLRRPIVMRRAPAVAQGTQNEQVVVRLERITHPAAGEANVS